MRTQKGQRASSIGHALWLLPAMLATGCMGLGGDWTFGDPTGDSTTGTASNSLEVLTSELRGDVFDVVNIAQDAILEESHYDGYSSVNSTVETAAGAAMTILEVQGGLNHPDLVPGSHFHFDNNSWASDTNGLDITVVGCAGPEVGYWQHDQPADNVDVDVDNDPSDPRALALTYRATFPAEEAWTADETALPASVVTGVIHYRRIQ